ncbi:MAG: ORF6N domain-containing protein [Anoxybacillus ayderensis]|nr:ORF6N domain-containing protein [Anoxybacillus ayderensis]
MNLQVIEQNGQRVLTTAQLAEAYGTDTKHISNNFSNNKERYKIGKHYFLLQGEELKQFLQSENLGMQNSSKIRALYLWTEKGAWLHAKSLNTDEAWEAYERLVDEYYNVKEHALNIQMLSPQLQALISIELRQKQLEQELEEAKKQMAAVQHRLDNIDKIDTIGDLQQRLNAMIRLYALKAGVTFSKAWADFRDAFNTAYRTNLTLRINNHKRATGKKKLTMPEFLSEVGQLEDAIRVADKLLNRQRERGEEKKVSV